MFVAGFFKICEALIEFSKSDVKSVAKGRKRKVWGSREFLLKFCC